MTSRLLTAIPEASASNVPNRAELTLDPAEEGWREVNGPLVYHGHCAHVHARITMGLNYA